MFAHPEVLQCLVVVLSGTPAAQVENAQKESELAVIQLTAAAEQRLGLRTEAVTQRTTSRTREVAGELVAPAGKSVIVSSPMAGTAMLTGLVPGSLVKRHQPVLRLAPLPSAADLSAAEARLIAARKRAERNTELLKEGAVSERVHDDALAELALAEANASAVRPRDRASGFATLTLEAPFDGVLRAIQVGDGQLVAPGAPLFVVEALTELWVRVAFPSPITAESVELRALGTTVPRTGTRIHAPPSADLRSATVDTFFAVDNADRSLRVGQRVLVAVPLDAKVDALSVPWSAIAYDAQGGTWVYERTTEHHYGRRRVLIRARVGDDALLDLGPALGTPVVTVGAAELLGVEFGAGK